MRIVSWNLAHQTHERPIHRNFLEAVKLLSPDVLVLNEYVHGGSRTEIMARLHEIGLKEFNVSKHISGQNQVLILSRSAQSAGDLTAPETTDAAKANFLHVSVSGIEVVGMRAPMFKTSELRAIYWNYMEKLIRDTRERRIVFIGDMNCDPKRSQKCDPEQIKNPGDRVLNCLKIRSWHIPSPGGDWSFISKDGKTTARIDHVIASPALTNVTTNYIRRINDVVLAGRTSDNAISDHAALVVEVGV